MGSLGLTATMAVRSAFALLCFALLCGLAASSGFQSETETELRTKNEGEAAGNQVLVADAVESRVARGSKKGGEKNACKEDPKSKKCLRQTRRSKQGAKNNNKPKNRPNKNGGKKKKNRSKKIQKKKSKKGGKSGKGGKRNNNRGRKPRKNPSQKKSAKKAKKAEIKEQKQIARQENKAKKIAKRLRKQQARNNEKLGKKASAKASNRNATVNLTCLTTAIQLLKFQKDNVNNFLSRHTRQIKQNALTTKKQGKKGEFAEPAARLIQSGGGNKSNLICGGSTNSTGAKQLLNLTNLLGCSAAIKTACTPPSGINQTFMTDCYEKSKGFNTTLTGCVSTALKGSDPCSCFTDAKLVGAMTKLKPCKGKDEAKLAAKARTTCLTQMRACNGYVELAGRLQYTCKYTADDLKKTLAQVTANNASVAAAMAKVKALTGVEASDNSSSSNSSRRARAAHHEEENIAPMDAVQQLMSFQGRHGGKREIRSKRATFTCASMTTAVQTCTTAVSSTPSGSTVISSCTIETTQTSVTCTDTEKTALQTVSNTLLVAQRIFTAFAVSILSELSESAGATPSTSELETLVNQITTGTSTKAASSRNRNMLRQMVLDKMKN